ncbi:four-carbon acid sugar kinase family protein (plasmid) [Deinococcus metallilatus]|uniref:Four-carbon acid sugar kinase family protein n=1 Tax=Deinococcus metallilatus TaxID=1211322 RepID=A0AAJ5JZM2_9DEIO|nr:four-carbon acid sugar kinase family protein [Deinococcus metallilatus]MBB5293471.1 uncharacterized protein YgbK (DUF1537 family) [Deinococcus metallilatus]QBY06555.1 four-carbon acid sugar kinase family protein [Deinococcus metallilatus]RXJ17898.1 four-carbon acid sugar kinase family protein [Deinococcus metallilatus]TLK32170.1 four-carbon acid sugar kinase family protein [Deinococcus metallilatus]GMA15309.1 membrane protein [Deinococcus metallilatus]
MPGVRFLILADDLTGASDAGVHLARHGYDTVVAFHGAPLPAPLPEGLVLDLDSRALPADEAASRVSAALQDATPELLYVKIDSTLRGPIAAQLQAAFAGSGRRRVVIAPALPSNGRTTVGGVQLLNGRPVHEGPAGRDPRTPVSESHLPTLLAPAHRGDVTVISRAELRDLDAVRAALRDHRWIIVDAETEEDLTRLVDHLPDPDEVLWVGSAGLAQALGRRFPGPHPVQEVPPHQVRSGVLTVVGSLNEVARQQLQALRQAGVPGVELNVEASEAALGQLVTALQQHPGAALYSGSTRGRHSSEAIAHALAHVAQQGVQLGLVHALVLTGGDTAVQVGKALGATGLRLFGEIEPGVPYGQLVGPRPLPVVTKAGGFGQPQTLVNAQQALLQGK